MSVVKSDPITSLCEMFDAFIHLESMEKAESDGFQKYAKALRRKIGQTSWEYRCNLRSATSPRPDFTKQITRDGYIYQFFLRHAYLVYIASQRNCNTLFGRGPPSSICAIGGGPGCDVVGLTMACKQSLADCKVHILDRCKEWELSWNALHENHLLSSKKSPEVTYHDFDFNDSELTPAQAELVRGADIVTMIKSLSPVTAMLRKNTPVHDDSAAETTAPKTSLYSILDHMTPGCMLLYIDNKQGTQRGVLEDTLAHLSFTVVDDEGLGKGAWLPSHDVFADADRQEYRNKLKFSPCVRAGKNELILLRKDK